MSSAAELFARRELLWNLTLRELRGRYKRSILGWGWSLLNPIAFMVVYTFAFSIILRAQPDPGDPSGISSYAIYLMSGLLPWTFFNVSVGESLGSIVANGPLVSKVAFPREHLVVSAIIAGLFTLAIEMLVLSAVLMFLGHVVLQWLPLVVLTSILVAVFATGFGLALAAANVYFRDLSYLWSIIVQAWFFSTPIVYPLSFVQDRLADRPTLLWIYEHVPMTVAINIYRDLLFNLRMPAVADFAQLAVAAVIALLAGWWLFDRLEGRFAEEL